MPPARPAALTAAAITALMLTGCGDNATSNTQVADASQAHNPSLEEATDTPLMNSLVMSPDQARLTLDVLPIDSTAPDAGAVDPEQFSHDAQAGPWGWTAVGLDNPACSVDHAARARDAVSIDITEDCAVTGGTWTDPLTNAELTQDATAVKSFVPLQHVWDTGGSAWTHEQRQIFVNSPFTLLTMGTTSSDERGDRSPAEWRPADKNLWCAYGLRWVDVKNSYGLSLESTAEHDALLEMVNTCPDEMNPDQAAG